MVTNKLRTATAKLATTLLANAAESITYTQTSSATAVSTSPLYAVPAETIREEQDGLGLIEKIEMQDFIVRQSDLVVSAAVIEPARGDTIVWDSKTYEVMGYGATGPPADNWGRYDVMWRVHTQLGGA